MTLRVWITSGGNVGEGNAEFLLRLRQKRIDDWAFAEPDQLKDIVAVRLQGKWTIMPFDRLKVMFPDISVVRKEDVRFFEALAPTAKQPSAPCTS